MTTLGRCGRRAMTSSTPARTSGPAGSSRVVTRGRSFAGPAARVRLTGPRARVRAASRRALVGRSDLALRSAVVLGHAALDLRSGRRQRRTGMGRAPGWAHGGAAPGGALGLGPGLALHTAVVGDAADHPRASRRAAARVWQAGPGAHVDAASRCTLVHRPMLALRALVPGQAAADEVVGAGDVGDQDGGRIRAAEDDRLAARIRAEVLVMEVRARGEPGAALTAACGRQRADLDAVQDDVVGAAA